MQTHGKTPNIAIYQWRLSSSRPATHASDLMKAVSVNSQPASTPRAFSRRFWFANWTKAITR